MANKLATYQRTAASVVSFRCFPFLYACNGSLTTSLRVSSDRVKRASMRCDKEGTDVPSAISTFGRTFARHLTLVGEANARPRVFFRAVDAETVAHVLASVPVFSALSDAERTELVAHLRARHFSRDEVVFHRDDAGGHFYVILSGSVKVAIPDEEGHEVVVAVERDGAVFGELALFDDAPRSATVTALDETQVVTLAREDFLRVSSEARGRYGKSSGCWRVRCGARRVGSRTWCSSTSPGGWRSACSTSQQHTHART